VIFATCGSTTYGFERLMEALAALPAAELEVQHGPSRPPACARAYAFLPFRELVDKMQEADAVVSHAGVGSIICAIQAGHVPVIFPRLKKYGEAVDDHQAELATALAESSRAVIAWTAADLPAAVASASTRRAANDLVSGGLAVAVRAAVRGEALDLAATSR
jgi:UDP-N-acetylglucosamine transferase subunit ALG13